MLVCFWAGAERGQEREERAEQMSERGSEQRGGERAEGRRRQTASGLRHDERVRVAREAEEVHSAASNPRRDAIRPSTAPSSPGWGLASGGILLAPNPTYRLN